MRRSRQVGIFIVVVASIGPTCGPTFRCGNDSVATFASPNAEMKAVVFRRSCGATTGFSTEVSILQFRDAAPNDNAGGNVFAVGDTLGPGRVEPDEEVLKVSVEWLSPQVARITYDERADVYRQELAREGVRLTYRTRR